MNSVSLSSFDKREFEIFKNRIHRKSGVDFGSYKVKSVKRRIFSRMLRTRCSTLREYNRLLNEKPEEYDLLLKTLTVNVTSFFRNGEVFNFLREKIIPDIISRGKEENNGKASIWSAACSTGEEPYSIAIILKEVLGLRIKFFDIYLLATDIDEDALDRAGQGIFGSEKIENIDAKLLRRYFSRKGDKFHIKSIIKNAVIFKKEDILSQMDGSSPFDLVMCRNVLIYIERTEQEMIFKNFSQVIRKGGYLILGKSETMSATGKKKFKLIDPDCRVYQRV